MSPWASVGRRLIRTAARPRDHALARPSQPPAPVNPWERHRWKAFAPAHAGKVASRRSIGDAARLTGSGRAEDSPDPSALPGDLVNPSALCGQLQQHSAVPPGGLPADERVSGDLDPSRVDLHNHHTVAIRSAQVGCVTPSNLAALHLRVAAGTTLRAGAPPFQRWHQWHKISPPRGSEVDPPASGQAFGARAEGDDRDSELVAGAHPLGTQPFDANVRREVHRLAGEPVGEQQRSPAGK